MDVPLLPILPTTPQEKFNDGFWVIRLHPNGDRYFNDLEGGVFTEFDPRTSNNAAVFQGATNEIRQFIAERNIVNDVSIVLALKDGMQVAYYLVDNDSKAIFWMEDVADVVAGLGPGHTGECLRK
ncbi:hypothetical protein FRC00_004096 [Tulasnella sp. 408]|nr:hypothetical protein FRC00_004096 [Tulasnella sp. 408]